MALFALPLDRLREYRPQLREPPDFDGVWRGSRAVGGRLLLDVQPVRTGLRLVDTWDVAFAGCGGAPIRAWYTRPAGVTAALPAVVEYLGYGRGRGLPH